MADHHSRETGSRETDDELRARLTCEYEVWSRKFHGLAILHGEAAAEAWAANNPPPLSRRGLT